MPDIPFAHYRIGSVVSVRVLFLGAILCAAALTVSAQTEAITAPLVEPFAMQWRASNSVWLRGPAISYLQARRQAYAIGSYPQAELSVWRNLVPQSVRDVVERELPEIASLQQYEPQQQVYLQDGSVIGRRVALFSKAGILRAEAEVFARESPSWVRVYDSSDLLLLEIEFVDRQIVHIDQFTYHDDALDQRTRSASDGTQQYIDRYSYRANGALRLVERTFPDGSVRSSQYSFYEHLLRGEVHTMPNARVIQIRYDEHGRILLERNYTDGEIAEETSFSYSTEEASRPERAVTSFGADERRIERIYQDGLETRTLEYDGSELQREEQLHYNDDRLLVERIATEDGRITRTEYRYGSDKALVEQRGLVNDVLREQRIFLDVVSGDMGDLSETTAALDVPAGTTEVLFLYSDGELALRVYYDEQQRIKEEVIHAGEIERIRRFGSPE